MKKHTTVNATGVTEMSVIMQLCTFLNHRGYIVWRHSNTGTFNAREAKAALVKLHSAVRSGALSEANFSIAIDVIFARCWKKTPGMVPGVFDIVGFNLVTGKFVAIEVKLGKDELRPEQREFKGNVEVAGGETYIVRDFPLFSHNFMTKRGERLAEA